MIADTVKYDPIAETKTRLNFNFKIFLRKFNSTRKHKEILNAC